MNAVKKDASVNISNLAELVSHTEKK